MPTAPTPSLPAREPQPQLVRRNVDGHEYIEKVRRGMIFLATVLPQEARGHEQNHAVPSAWLIVSSRPVHRMKLVQAVPLTSKLHKGGEPFRQHRILIREDQILRYHVDDPVPGFREGTDSLALVEQTRVLAHDRLLGNPVARITKDAQYAIEAALKFVFAMDLPAGG